MDLKSLFLTIKNTFNVKKTVEFDDLRIIMEPLNTLEEMKVLEACSGSGDGYISQLKKSSIAFAIRAIGVKDANGKFTDTEFKDDVVEYTGDDNKPIKETKYLFMLHQIEAWPVAFRDSIFVAFNDMLLELEDLIEKKVKFERFSIQTVPESMKREEPTEVPKGFKKIEKEEELSDAEKLSNGVPIQADLGRNAKKV
jgi:hypothetical protein